MKALHSAERVSREGEKEQGITMLPRTHDRRYFSLATHFLCGEGHTAGFGGRDWVKSYYFHYVVHDKRCTNGDQSSRSNQSHGRIGDVTV